MRLLAIGDIHGCFTAFSSLWEFVRPAEDDRVVFLGDYVDRGLECRKLIERLLPEGRNPRRVFLRGNHEVMMLDARNRPFDAESWMSCGGAETLASYGARGEKQWAGRIPASHWDFLEATERYYETPRHIFVHACVEPQLDLDQQPDDLLFWETFEQMRKPHKSGKKVVCGHAAQMSGLMNDNGYAVCIDTGAVYGGWLTCLDANTGEFWQADESGRTRQGRS